MDGILDDERFAHIKHDLRYREVSKKKKKVYLDERFSSLLTDKFNDDTGVGPRGRPVNHSTKEDLRSFYQLPDENTGSSKRKTIRDTSSSASDVKNGRKKNKKMKKSSSSLIPIVDKELLKPDADYARGETALSDSSLDDSSSSEEENDIEFEWAELDNDADWDIDGNNVEETRRFAVCNMDWDIAKAVDLYMLFTSFCPPGGHIKCVAIYTSDYGKKKLEEEKRFGPQEFVKMMALQKRESDDDNSEDENDNPSTKHLEILRKYQRNKLKYFYSNVECDSIRTASYIYKECDRQPLEGAGVCLDLRYIPDDMIFNEDPHDICSSAPSNYDCLIDTPNTIFDSRPSLNWDETDRTREKDLHSAMNKALNKEDIDDEILKKYIGSGSSSEEDDDENINNNKFVDENFSPSEEDTGSSNGAKQKFTKLNNGRKLDGHLVSQDGNEERENLQLLFGGSDSEDVQSQTSDTGKQNSRKQKMSLKKMRKLKIKEKLQKKDNSGFKVNVEDPRFKDVLTSGDFNIDPSHPNFKETSQMKEVLQYVQDRTINTT